MFPNPQHPVRKNVEFFIGLRDKVEHRYATDLEPVIAGLLRRTDTVAAPAQLQPPR